MSNAFFHPQDPKALSVRRALLRVHRIKADTIVTDDNLQFSVFFFKVTLRWRASAWRITFVTASWTIR